MVQQQVVAGIPKRVRLSLWKRLILVTLLLLSGESLVAVVSSQPAHADSFTYIVCDAGRGGNGGMASHGSSGGDGGGGGDCVIYGAKSGSGGTSTGGGANGGDVFFRP